VALATSPALVGREQELERVHAFLDLETATRLLLEGDAGIGKTTLWTAALDDARGRGFRVLHAAPAAAERDLSFTALGDLLADLRDAIGALPAPQRRALRTALLLEDAESSPPDQRTIAVALTELLRRTSREAPLLVAIDDAHWLDGPSSIAVEFASRRLQEERVRLLVTARVGGEVSLAFKPAERLAVGPLSVDELDELVRRRLETRLSRPVVRQLADASGGNPFYALELAADLVRSGRALEPGERLPIPTHLRTVAMSRLDALSPEAREAVLATAALAQPTADVVANVVGRSGAIEDAIAAGVLERDGDSLHFTHPLFAASAYEDAAQHERQAMHARLGRVVTEPEERARQLAEGTDRPDAKIATFVEAAAASVAARGAPDAAARLAKLAVALTPPTRHAVLHKRRLDHARFVRAAGDPSQARALLERQLVDAAPGHERAEVRLELARTEFTTRGITTATRHLETALGDVSGRYELELEAMILTDLADLRLGDLQPDRVVSGRAVALAQSVWNPSLLARALAVHGLTLVDAGEPPTDDYWIRALDVERDSGELKRDGPTCAFGVALLSRGDFERSSELLHAVADSMRQRGDPALSTVLLNLSDLERIAGRWRRAAAYADEAYDVAVQTGSDSLEPMCLLYKARFVMLGGDLAAAQRQVEQALALLEELDGSESRRAVYDRDVPQTLANSLLGRIDLMSGRFAEAHERFAADIAAHRKMNQRALLVETQVDDVNALLGGGDLEGAVGELAAIQRLVAELDNSWMSALAARAAGLVAAAKGELEPALRSLHDSRARLESLPSPWPFELARTLLALGSVQRVARQKLPARASLERALAIFEELGTRLWADKARGELDQIGGRPSHAHTLTETEARVAASVAAGRSNAEAARELFMSPKTVEWNLSKIYKKLHVRSRTELAAKLAKQPQS
jgi:DNA-binding CsgD family transcriptional regulator